jgi:hypothetical protein
VRLMMIVNHAENVRTERISSERLAREDNTEATQNSESLDVAVGDHFIKKSFILLGL